MITGFCVEIRRYFCMVIENLKHKVHMDDAEGNIPKVIPVIPEHATGHSVCCFLSKVLYAEVFM
jgi:hypothetical protein